MCPIFLSSRLTHFNFSFRYIGMGLNCFATACYVLVMKYATKSMKVNALIKLNSKLLRYIYISYAYILLFSFSLSVQAWSSSTTFQGLLLHFQSKNLGANRNTYTFIDVHTKFGVPHLSCIMLLLLSIGYGEVTSLFKGDANTVAAVI